MFWDTYTALRSRSRENKRRMRRQGRHWTNKPSSQSLNNKTTFRACIWNILIINVVFFLMAMEFMKKDPDSTLSTTTTEESTTGTIGDTCDPSEAPPPSSFKVKPRLTFANIKDRVLFEEEEEPFNSIIQKKPKPKPQKNLQSNDM